MPTKLPHYVLPLYPAVTGLLLLALVNGGIDRFRRGSVATALLAVEFHLIDTGHFALEDKADEMVPLIRDFLARKVPA